MKHILRKPTGQIAALLVVILPVVVGAVALGADFAIIYYNWAVLRKAADAAALAGAGYLPGQPSVAVSQATSYAKLNGIKASEITSTTPAADRKSITVQLARTVPYNFGRVLGLTNANISVLAKAGIVPTGGFNGNGNNLIPIGIDCPPNSCYSPGATVILTQNQVGPGNWSFLGLANPGGKTLRTQLANGYQGQTISVGEMVSTQTGLQVGNAVQGFGDRFAASDAANLGDGPTNPNPLEPRVVEVPIVDFTKANGSSQVPVTGFAELWLNSYSNKQGLTATFIKAVSGGNIPDPGGQDFGSAVPVLLQ